MPGVAFSPYPWRRTPRLSQRVRYGQSELAHRELDVLLDEFDQEHDVALAPRKLRCGMVMSYCLRGARLGGAASEPIVDEIMSAIDRLALVRSWSSARRLMHDYIDRLLAHVVQRGQTRVEGVVRQMQLDLANDPRLAQALKDYADDAGLHPDYLSRQFRYITGQTFCEARRIARLDRARHLLIGSAWKVREVARRVGINDPSQFNREFRSEFGMPPRRYRLRHNRG